MNQSTKGHFTGSRRSKLKHSQKQHQTTMQAQLGTIMMKTNINTETNAVHFSHQQINRGTGWFVLIHNFFISAVHFYVLNVSRFDRVNWLCACIFLLAWTVFILEINIEWDVLTFVLFSVYDAWQLLILKNQFYNIFPFSRTTLNKKFKWRKRFWNERHNKKLKVTEI